MTLDSFPQKKLGVIAKQRKSKAYPDKASQLPFIGMEHIQPHTLKPTGFGRFSEMKSAANTFEIGDVLYGRMRPYLNKVYKAEVAGTCSGEFIVFEPRDVDADYLKFFLHSRDFVKYASSLSSGDRPRVDFKRLETYPVFLPSPTTQTNIVSRIDQLFSQLDDGEKALQHAEAQLARYKQAVLKAAVSGELTREWREKNPTLAKPWKESTLGEVATLRKSKVYPDRQSSLPFIGMEDILPHTTTLAHISKFSDMKSAGNEFFPNDVIYGRMRAYLNKVHKCEFHGVCSGEFIVFQENDVFLPDFLVFILHGYDFVRFASAISTGDRPRIDFKKMAPFAVSVPSMDEQREILSKAKDALSLFARMENELIQVKKASNTLRQSILHAAFSGQLVKETKA